MLLTYQYNDARETKRWKKIVAFLLSFALVFGALFQLMSQTAMAQDRLEVNAMLSDYTKGIIQTAGTVALDKEPMENDRNVVAVKNRDGSNTAYIFSEPITYEDADGSIRTKDISIGRVHGKDLVELGYDYENGQNDIRIAFSKDPAVGVRVSHDSWAYYMSPAQFPDELEAASASGKPTMVPHMDEELVAFQYNGLYGAGSALNFYPELNGVKEEIVIREPNGFDTYTFTLKTTGATAQLNDDGTITIVNAKTNEEVQTIKAPFAYDAEYLGDDPEDRVHYSPAAFDLSEPEKGEDGTLLYTLRVILDDDWLSAETTSYPITIDPTSATISNRFDAGVYSAKATTNYGSAETACFGRASSYGYGRALEYFWLPSDVDSYTTINSAYYWLRETTGRTTTTYVTPYAATSYWLESTVTWNIKPSYNSSYAQQTKCINGNSSDTTASKHWYRFNIANAVNAWKNGTLTNRGLMFISNEETNGAYNWRAFACKEHSTSSYHPYVVINYTNDTTPPTYTNITPEMQQTGPIRT